MIQVLRRFAPLLFVFVSSIFVVGFCLIQSSSIATSAFAQIANSQNVRKVAATPYSVKEDDVIEAALRYQLRWNKQAKVCFITVEGLEPDEKFLSRFKNQTHPRIIPRSQEAYDRNGRLIDSESGELAEIISIVSIKWLNDTEAEVRTNIYMDGVIEYIQKVVLKDDKWIALDGAYMDELAPKAMSDKSDDEVKVTVSGGGGSAPRDENANNDPLIKIVVTGRVVDHLGQPIQGAKVHASLGLDLEGKMVETDADGRFRAESGSQFWFKERCNPGVSAYAKNYDQEFVFFDCSDWKTGEPHFEQTIVLKANAVKLEENRRLWREKGFTDYDLTVEFDKSGEYRGPKPVLIKIRNGRAASIQILDEKYKTVPLDEAVKIYGQFDTVEKIFDYIQKALDEKARVSASYDKNLGYPTKSSALRIDKGSEQYEWITIEKLEIVPNE